MTVSVPLVLLDRIEPGEPKPDYCVHGRATCVACDDWCWLGDQTHDAVKSRRALPMCRQCAAKLLPGELRFANLGDHRRADGPHEDRQGEAT